MTVDYNRLRLLIIDSSYANSRPTYTQVQDLDEAIRGLCNTPLPTQVFPPGTAWVVIIIQSIIIITMMRR